MEIFLVEDSPPVRARLAEMLAAIPGATLVGQATNAADATQGILTLRPQVVVLDLSLGGGSSGFDVLRNVHGVAPEIDFYMLSNFSADPYRQLAEKLGARDFFDKTREFNRVRDVIASRAAIH
ncbi:MAG TPA: response regulator [Burkholderiales bacterium]|nr:response regulator [Burkholderiales bacterium]